ncbi:MAG: NAD-dependent epimerase/dehydratase family protein [Promethearchaeota archaeon]
MNLKNKEILVTGGTGFIGSAIVNKLINMNCKVNIISLPDDYVWRIEKKEECKFFYVNLLNFNETLKCIKAINPEIIFHLAGIVTPETDFKTIQKAFSVNFDGTKNLILSLNDLDYDLLINTGTGNEYGGNISPLKESERENPVTPYSASKVAGTYFCEMIATVYNQPIITVRPFLTYGPKQLAKFFVPWLIYCAIEKKEISLTQCQQTRDFVYIDDIADAYVLLAENVDKVRSKGIFNIGSGKETKLIDIVNIIKNRFNSAKIRIGEQPYRKGESMRFYSSIDKITELIGWAPKWTIEDGINKTIDWWLNNKDVWNRYKDIF